MNSNQLEKKSNFDKGFDRIHAFKTQVLKKELPEAQFRKTSIFGSPEKEVRTFNGIISSFNLTKDTIYEFDGSKLFLHFTSLLALSQILSSGFLRMSDFNCLTDKSEMIFSANNLWGELNQNQIVKTKSKLFCLSACESNSKTIKDGFMWKNYAQNGKGCAIEYKFTQPEIYNMNFGKIQYGKRQLKPLKEIKRLADKFAIENNGFMAKDLPFLLSRLHSLHKDIKYKNEKEVRLLYFNDGFVGRNSHLNEYQDFYKDGSIRNFIKLYLAGSNEHFPKEKLTDEQVLSHSPQIEIKRIIIGPEIQESSETAYQLDYFRKEFGMDFSIWHYNKNGHLYECQICIEENKRAIQYIHEEKRPVQNT